MDELGDKLNELAVSLKLCKRKTLPYNPPNYSGKNKRTELVISPAPWAKKEGVSKSLQIPMSGKSYLLDRDLAAALHTYLNHWRLPVLEKIHSVKHPIYVMEHPSRPSNAIEYLINALVNNLRALIEAVSLCPCDSAERHRVIKAMSYADFTTSLFGYALTEAEEADRLATLSPILMRVREVYEEMLDVAISCGRSSAEWATALRQFQKALTALLDHLPLIRRRGKLREKWITETKAAKMLAVHRGTVGRMDGIVTNGKTGKEKRISLLSVLRLEYDKNMEYLEGDALDLRKDRAGIADAEIP